MIAPQDDEKSLKAREWIKAIKEEMESMKTNQV
jgi:hypothetical protein